MKAALQGPLMAHPAAWGPLGSTGGRLAVMWHWRSLRPLLLAVLIGPPVGLAAEQVQAQSPQRGATSLSTGSPAVDIQVHALFGGMAVLAINGERVRLRDGELGPGGARLLAATTSGARIEVDGRVRTLTLQDARFGGEFSAPAGRRERVHPDSRGSYTASGAINGRAVTFLVDTGASLVAINEEDARALGLSSTRGTQPLTLETAQGIVVGRALTLDSVRLGGIELRRVEAVILPGRFPREPLLGMSFLSQLDWRSEAGVLVLETRNR
ncbi:MAG: TIGR02281 family clan AA aspartic protease [Thioalkalivibrionaceae bacterium]